MAASGLEVVHVSAEAAAVPREDLAIRRTLLLQQPCPTHTNRIGTPGGPLPAYGCVQLLVAKAVVKLDAVVRHIDRLVKVPGLGVLGVLQSVLATALPS